MSFEQLSLFESRPKSVRDVKCKFEPPLRRYFCEDNWWATECIGCPNYKEDNRLELWGTDEDTKTKYISYLEFKTWLYTNFPMFIDNETDTDVWEYKNISVQIKTYNKLNDDGTDNHDQFVSVGWFNKNSGWSSPNDTLGEVKDSIKRALDYEQGKNTI